VPASGPARPQADDLVHAKDDMQAVRTREVRQGSFWSTSSARTSDIQARAENTKGILG